MISRIRQWWRLRGTHTDVLIVRRRKCLPGSPWVGAWECIR